MAAAEVGLEVGRSYTIAEFQTRKAPNMQLLGMAKSNSNSLYETGFNPSGEYHEIVRMLEHDSTRRETYERVEEYFTNLATRPSVGVFHYRASSALADMLFNKPDVDGLLYPSCASGYCSTNACLSSHFADQYMSISKLWNVKVSRTIRTSDTDVKIMYALNECTQSISKDGYIDWSQSAMSGSPIDELHDIGGDEEENTIRYGRYAGEGGLDHLVRDVFS